MFKNIIMLDLKITPHWGDIILFIYSDRCYFSEEKYYAKVWEIQY